MNDVVILIFGFDFGFGFFLDSISILSLVEFFFRVMD